MRLRNTSTPLVLVASAFTVATFAACSGIDGLPENPLNPSASDAASDAAVADANDASAAVDAGMNDVSVPDASVGDSGNVDSSTVDAGGDATVDAAPCVSETDNAFCTRLGKNCGAVTAADNCGVARTVASCGVCSSYYDSCGGGNVPNVCGCTPESDWSFCTRTGRSCGSASGADNCGQSRTVASCGGACVDAGPSDAGTVDAGAVDASAVQRWTFTNCTATGATGPTQAQCDTAYAGTNLAGAVTLNAGIQTWTVPANGAYRITAMGAQGGGTNNFGRGALIQGDFDFAVGAQIKVLVGQRGLDGACLDSLYQQVERGSASGGGGSFVVNTLGDALVVAGGGGGSGSVSQSCACSTDGVGYTPQAQRSCGYVNQSSGSCSGSAAGAFAGCGSQQGTEVQTPSPGALSTIAGGGGGFTGACANSSLNPNGRSFAEGGAGGQVVACRAGGFGGGGGGGGVSTCWSGVSSCYPSTIYNGAGAGGGYSGGTAGSSYSSAGSGLTAGSGGSSFSSGANPINLTGYRAGDGLVVIERIR